MSGPRTYRFAGQFRAAAFIALLTGAGYRAAIHAQDWQPGVFRVSNSADTPALQNWAVEVYNRPGEAAPTA